MTFNYIRSEPGLWTVGSTGPGGKWEPESDHDSADEAARRVAWLNGSGPDPDEDPDEDPETPSTFDEWCIVELFGHQRYAGLVRQAEWPPGFARLEIPATPGHEAMTQLLSPQSIYRLTPTTEQIATAVAAQCRPEPVRRWELPATPVERDDESERAMAVGPDPNRDPEWYVRQRAEHGALLRMGGGDDEHPF